jgi:ABC-2 type transport system ATP-binding protein
MKTQNGTVVEVRNLVKQYPGVKAVDDISFNVYQGEIFGMVGPNGAGKTTTIECVEGLRQPDGGSIQVEDSLPVPESHSFAEFVAFPSEASQG